MSPACNARIGSDAYMLTMRSRVDEMLMHCARDPNQ